MELDIKPTYDTKRDLLQNVKNLAGHSVNLYKTPTYGSSTALIQREEAEDLFRQRLEALHMMETHRDNKDLPLVNKALRNIKSYEYKANCIIMRTMDKQQQSLDHASHMLTRMFCVHHPSLWIWFKTNEKKLFNLRLRDQASSLSGAQLEAILSEFNFNFQRVVGVELSELYRENLVGWNKHDRDKADIFRVRFTDALKFVARRAVSLKGGYAYLTRYEIISVVCDVFERHLDSEFRYAQQHLNTELVKDLLEALSLVYQDFQEKLDEEKRKLSQERSRESNSLYDIDIENLDQLVKDNFPPCMRYLQESLTQDNHLKHQGRLYYGAFLRSGNVSMDEAIEFWRKEFTKKIPNDKFERDYKYNIRHLYGKEGHKKALSCFSCDKIINDNAPSASDKHGCPFRHFDEANLEKMLKNHGIKDVDIGSIQIKTKAKEYKEACGYYFKTRHGHELSDVVRNPMQFYCESRRVATLPPVEEAEHQENQALGPKMTEGHVPIEDASMEMDDDW